MPVSTDITSHLAADVRQGLHSRPRRLSSKYFYDERGSEIFRQIMRMPAYYPTDCEFEIFETHRAALHRAVTQPGSAFRLIEFGVGDGLKTKVLLEHFLDQRTPFTFTPIDISGDALRQLHETLVDTFPDLPVDPIEDDYFRALDRLQGGAARKVVLFLGSNIGNFQRAEAVTFLRRLREGLAPGDLVLIGFDLKKDPEIILRAYHDPEGITRDFNLNLLTRLNRELGADFDLAQWQHAPVYDPLSGETRSYLLSRRAQTVTIEALDESFAFQPWEPIWTELSQKFDLDMIGSLAREAGFQVQQHFHDRRGWFVDSLWEVEG